MDSAGLSVQGQAARVDRIEAALEARAARRRQAQNEYIAREKEKRERKQASDDAETKRKEAVERANTLRGQAEAQAKTQADAQTVLAAAAKEAEEAEARRQTLQQEVEQRKQVAAYKAELERLQKEAADQYNAGEMAKANVALEEAIKLQKESGYKFGPVPNGQTSGAAFVGKKQDEMEVELESATKAMQTATEGLKAAQNDMHTHNDNARRAQEEALAARRAGDVAAQEAAWALATSEAAAGTAAQALAARLATIRQEEEEKIEQVSADMEGTADEVQIRENLYTYAQQTPGQAVDTSHAAANAIPVPDSVPVPSASELRVNAEIARAGQQRAEAARAAEVQAELERRTAVLAQSWNDGEAEMELEAELEEELNSVDVRTKDADRPPVISDVTPGMSIQDIDLLILDAIRYVSSPEGATRVNELNAVRAELVAERAGVLLKQDPALLEKFDVGAEGKEEEDSHVVVKKGLDSVQSRSGRSASLSDVRKGRRDEALARRRGIEVIQGAQSNTERQRAVVGAVNQAAWQAQVGTYRAQEGQESNIYGQKQQGAAALPQHVDTKAAIHHADVVLGAGDPGDPNYAKALQQQKRDKILLAEAEAVYNEMETLRLELEEQAQMGGTDPALLRQWQAKRDEYEQMRKRSNHNFGQRGAVSALNKTRRRAVAEAAVARAEEREAYRRGRKMTGAEGAQSSKAQKVDA